MKTLMNGSATLGTSSHLEIIFLDYLMLAVNRLERVRIVLHDIGVECLHDMIDVCENEDLMNSVKEKVTAIDYKRIKTALTMTAMFEGHLIKEASLDLSQELKRLREDVADLGKAISGVDDVAQLTALREELEKQKSVLSSHVHRKKDADVLQRKIAKSAQRKDLIRGLNGRCYCYATLHFLSSVTCLLFQHLSHT